MTFLYITSKTKCLKHIVLKLKMLYNLLIGSKKFYPYALVANKVNEIVDF
jgi:hypothetical protein